MRDVLIHYLEVNFDEIAGELARARAEVEASAADPSAAAERLRQVIRDLNAEARRQKISARMHPAYEGWEPGRGADGVIAALCGIEAPERAVLDRYVDLFSKSMRHAPPVPLEEAAEPSPEAASEAAVAAPLVPAGESALEAAPARIVAEQTPGVLQTILLAAAQQALDLLHVDASLVYTVANGGRFVLRAGVPTDSLAPPEVNGILASGLLARALEQNEVLSVEDIAAEAISPDERAWVEAGYHGFAAVALAPPLERPLGVLALFRCTPWRLDRPDALRLEDLALEAVSALRAQSLAVKVEEVAVLQERLKLAREIHDGLASDLATVVALFKYYEQRREKDPQDAAQLLSQLRTMTEENLQSARNILQSLRPKTIRSEGLLASVLKLVDQFGRTYLIETTASLRGDENELIAEQKEGIFQILREILSNVRKHAQARNVSVSLDLSVSPWVLSVRDDGRGFDVSRVGEESRKSRSYGLIGMRERTRLLDGTLEISSRPGEGTRVTLIGPIEPSTRPERQGV